MHFIFTWPDDDNNKTTRTTTMVTTSLPAQHKHKAVVDSDDNAALSVPQFKIRSVFDPEDKFGFVYSFSRIGIDQPQPNAGKHFLALNVPCGETTQGVAGVMNFLSSRTVKNAQSVSCNGLDLITKEITGQRKRELFQTHLRANERSDERLYELVPRFDFWKTQDRPAEWGRKPAAPEGKHDLVEEIIGAWRPMVESYGYCRHLDRNPGNNSIMNLKRVHLHEALLHIEDWTVDWFSDLNAEQVEYVRSHSAYFAEITKVVLRPLEFCCYCRLMEDQLEADKKLKKCGGCRALYYCSVSCQRADWREHKKRCAMFAHSQASFIASLPS